MAKLDEITELLTNEMDGFNKSIIIFKDQISQLKNIDLKPQINSLNENFIANIEKLKHLQLKHLKQQESIVQKNSSTKILKIICMILFVFSLVSFLYANHLSYQIQLKEKEAYNKGTEDIKIHIQAFFKDNPKAKKIYNKWNKK
jgi:hypothetical protein